MQKTSLLVGVVSFTVIVLFPCQAYQLTGPNQNVDNKMGEVFLVLQIGLPLQNPSERMFGIAA